VEKRGGKDEMRMSENEANRGIAHLRANEGKPLWVVDDLITLKARSADTDGTFALLEERTPPQGGPPPHIHHQEEEALYVLEGELESLVDERTIRASAGSFFYVPRGTLHTFKNVGTSPSRVLGVISPAGLEKFFEEVGEPATEGASAPEGPPDVEKLIATARKWRRRQRSAT